MTELLTIPEVAKRLTISVRSVYRLIDDGHLPAVLVRTAARAMKRVRADVLARYIEDLPPADGGYVLAGPRKPRIHKLPIQRVWSGPPSLLRRQAEEGHDSGTE